MKKIEETRFSWNIAGHREIESMWGHEGVLFKMLDTERYDQIDREKFIVQRDVGGGQFKEFGSNKRGD